MTSKLYRKDTSIDNLYFSQRASLAREMESNFVIPERLQPELATYKLRYWSIDHFLGRLQKTHLGQDAFVLDDNNTYYYITIQEETLASLRAECRKNPLTQIRVSFRRARLHWNLAPRAVYKVCAPLAPSHAKLKTKENLS